MNLENRTGNGYIDASINKVRDLLKPGSRMTRELINKNDFKYGSGTGAEVVLKLVFGTYKTIPVFTYRPKNPFTKAIAYRDTKGIHFNIYKLPGLTTVDIAGTLLHEMAHEKGYNHGTGWFANRKTQDKCLFSVPYYLSENVGRWL